MYYTKSSLINFTKSGMEEHGCIAVKYDFSKVWRNFNEIPTDGVVRYFIINDKTKAGMSWGYDIYLHPSYATCQKKDPCNAKGVFAELLDNLDQILAGNYVSKAELSKQKREAAAARKQAKEEMLLADCKTFNVDFFNGRYEKDGYLDAITEVGSRLQNGKYSDLVLNDLIKLSYRTNSKNKNTGYTVSVSFGESHRSFTYDNKYGDLWEDIDDNINMEIYGTLLSRTTFLENEVDSAFARSQWVDKFAEMEKENDQNSIMYDLLSIYFSPESFVLTERYGRTYYENIYDKGDLSLGSVLSSYFSSPYSNTVWINKQLNALSEVPELKEVFNK